MYQAISYNYTTKTSVIRDDEKGWIEVPYTPTYYKLDKEGEFFTLEGKRVSPCKEFDKNHPCLIALTDLNYIDFRLTNLCFPQ